LLQLSAKLEEVERAPVFHRWLLQKSSTHRPHCLRGRQ
jgi:hypothetical protein